jgi:hypothetical protein
MTLRLISSLTIALGLLALGTPSEATLITYSNQAAFLSDTGASSATGALPNIGPVAPGFTVGSVSFTTLSGTLFMGTPPNEWSSLIPGADIAISGVESFQVGLAAPVYSLGFDFHEPTKHTNNYPDDCFATCFDSTFEVTLLSGGVAIPGASFTYNATDDVLAFVGVWTDFAFDGARIIDVTNTIDDEYWGEFYTGTRSAATPEPGTLLVLVSALGAARLLRRRRLIRS